LRDRYLLVSTGGCEARLAKSGMITTAFEMSETRIRHATRLSRSRSVSDLAADWKRWTLAERIGAALFVSAVLLAAVAASTALASGGH
jgi:hypothetical protein